MTEKNHKSKHKETSSDSDGHSPSRTQSVEKPSFFVKIFPFLRARQTSSLRDDLTDALSVEQSEDNTLFSPEERLMLNNILRLRETRVEDVMIPRSEIEALEINTSLANALDLFEKNGHSRMPVYVDTMDDPRGMIHIRDVLNFITRSARPTKQNGKLDLQHIDFGRPIGELDLIRTVLFVPGSMMAGQLLNRMQATRTQMALIIDEYGGTDGLASMEDIVELVVGDIEDEHDDEDVLIIKEPDNKWLVDASAELEDVEKALGPDFVIGELGEDVDTIGGLTVSAMDRIPAKGELIEAVPGFNFQIVEADKRRIKRICIQRIVQNEKKVNDHQLSSLED
ncbi:hemolysin family protein [Bartonella tamiae]|uniref:CBS domain-containing protein n=1 Tax=Bartonella tamiae Th239 TaxID=1094558 RepID=J0ZRD4_9HYPH|nr:hemolysin family protein [Bartonella tamiae]EJF91253.1 hypothetical protein ME5_00585 [Bartonella tamiae Th239]EJF93082.1 hypothetical protein MEG_01296 [Bartonella tamiae Th307]